MPDNMTESLEKAFSADTEILDIIPTEKKLEPLFDRVLVEPIAEEAHELMVEEITGSKPTKGTVLAVGPGRVTDAGVLVPMTVQVGDEVAFKQYQADEIDDGALLIFQERQLLGVWR